MNPSNSILFIELYGHSVDWRMVLILNTLYIKLDKNTPANLPCSVLATSNYQIQRRDKGELE